MAIASGASNLFFNRDTKVFLGQSTGYTILGASLATNVITTSAAHGLSTGDRVVFSALGTLTGITVGTIYYVNAVSTTTVSLFTTISGAIAGTTPVTLAGTVTSTTVFSAIDKYVTATTVAPSLSTNLTVPTSYATGTFTLVAHGYLSGKPYIFSNISTLTGVTVNTVYYVIRLTADTFQLAATYANAVASTPVAITAPGGTLGTPVVYSTEATSSIKITPTALATDAYTLTAHGLTAGQRIYYTAIGSATNVTVNTVYYVLYIDANTFKLSATSGGTAIVLGSTIGSPSLFTYDGSVTFTGTQTHGFNTGDIVSLSNVTDFTRLDVNGVYKAFPINTTSFSVVTGAAITNTATALTTPTTVRSYKTNMWELPVLAGYSASQSTTTTEITLTEMSDANGATRRGRQMFNTALSPTEWSFDTYVRPFSYSSNIAALEEPLWANLVARNAATVSGSAGTQTAIWATAVAKSASAMTFDFNSSNAILLGTFDLYFVMGANKAASKNYGYDPSDGGATHIYKVTDSVINEVSISFEIDGIATLKWSGMGSSLTEQGAVDATTAGYTGRDSTTNFIRNRLTAATVVGTTPTSTTYAITLTGGQITISNNISYLTPEILGVINKPLGHVVGTRNIQGTFTCYLDETANGSIDLFQNIAEKGVTTVTNSHAINFFVGGQGLIPQVQVTIPTAHLEVPTINFDDVIATEVKWHALPATISGTSEISAITYKGATL